MKDWFLQELNKERAKKISEDEGLPVFSSILLDIRGITEHEKIVQFFDVNNHLNDPFLIKDMKKAADRIREAVERYEKICIFGDYDCDGITATALLFLYLESVFANVIYYIPDRSAEGYGMNKGAIEKLKDQGVQLIVTVDNGIAALDEINYANDLGIDVVVTDHHKPQDVLPNAVAVVDPHRTDDTSPYKDYCGAGLALKLVMALDRNSFLVMENYAELAAIGTIADLVPLDGENRTIAKAGLFNLENTERIGTSILIEKAQIKKINAGNIGFKFAPRINASGRLSSPYNALELIITEDEEIAEEKAELLSKLNSERQAIEADIFKEVCDLIDSNSSMQYDRVLVISSPGWNQGVIGIVASSVTEKYGKPSIIISEGELMCRASCRSITGFSMVDAIFACSELLEKYGGHTMAAGFDIKKSNIDEFRKRINEYAYKMFPHMPLATVRIDCNLNPSRLSVSMAKQLQMFEPFGYGNPKPVFGLTGMRLDQITSLSGGKHLRLTVSRDNSSLCIMKYSTTIDDFPYKTGDVLDFAVTLELNEFRGEESLSFGLKDIRYHDFDCKSAMYEIQDYEMYKKGLTPEALPTYYPEREDFASVYVYIRNNPRSIYSIDLLLSSINNARLGAFKLLIILDILNDVHLIEYERNGDIISVKLFPTKLKVDLKYSQIYKRLKEDIDDVGKST